LPTGFIETEHLLLGLMREDALLKIKLVNPEALRNELHACIETKDAQIAPSADLPLSNEAAQALTRAAEQANELNHRSIDSGHLVLGVFAMKGKAADALQRQGVDYHGYREAVTESPEARAKPVAVEETRAAPEPAPVTDALAPSLREAVSKLEQLVEQTSVQLSGMPEALADRPLKRRPWTRKEALGHLIDWATTHHRWFARALTEPQLAVPGYPEDNWVRSQRYAEYSWMHLQHLWASLNRLLIHVLAGIPEEKLTMNCRVGVEAPRTLKALIDSYVYHCEDLVGQILAHG
jgi:hypothetical protein